MKGLQVSPAARLDPDELYDFIAAAWPSEAMGDWCRRGRIAHSTYDWDVSLVGMLDGAPVTHVGVYDMQMRIGRSLVRAAGINIVCTHPDYRGQGLMRETYAEALSAMRRGGYDLSVVLGSGMYARFGYVPGWPPTEYLVPTDLLPAKEPDVELRPFDTQAPGNREPLAPFYNRDHEGVTGTIVRPVFTLAKTAGDPDDEGHFLVDATGMATGYVLGGIARGGAAYYVYHAAGDAEQVVRAIAALARRHGCENVWLPRLPYHGPLCRRLRRIVPALSSQPERLDQVWWVQLINLGTTMQKIAPELERRLRRSHLFDWTGDLLVSTPEERVTLSIAGGRITVGEGVESGHTIEGGPEVAQLILGCEEPRETVEETGIRLSGAGTELVEALFPYQRPTVGEDAF